jgi:hypothetical protein
MSATREVLKTAYIRKAKRACLEHALQNQFVTIDDVREAVPFPDLLNPKINGEVMDYFCRLHYLIGESHEKSRRRVAHKRPITLWRLTNAPEAREWLRDHPDILWPEDAKVEGPQLTLFD